VSRADDPFAPEPTRTPPAPSAPLVPTTPLLVAAKPAAALLGISRTTLDALVRKGEIRAVRLGGRVLFAVAELERVARGEGGAS
jgi:excisionase family DNA binding protein